jgi:2-polyprenyl-3-methyl-5-hydroxy-6-metoxy-1,4-benzoquinol methylase
MGDYLGGVRSAYGAWRTYKKAPLPTQAFLAARIALLPLRPILDEINIHEGRVISLGCGYGLLEQVIAREFPRLEIIGVEFDSSRVELANRASIESPQVRFTQGDASSFLDEATTAQLCLAVDLLHHLSDEKQQNLVSNLFAATRADTKIVVKDIARTPSWMHTWNSAHDRIVSGEVTNCKEPEEMMTILSAAGFQHVDGLRLRRFDPYPHYMVTATRER